MKRFLKIILFWSNMVICCFLVLSYMANFINPIHIWFIAFFGLIYPFILLINIGFIILWIWKKKWFFIISLFTVIIGWSNVGRFLQLSILKKNNPQENYTKLLSFNVRLFNRYNWEKGYSVRDSILDYVYKENASIVCFQEFYTNHKDSLQSETYLNQKLGHLPFHHIHYTYQNRASSDFGIATYSNVPIIRRGSILFSDSYNTFIYSDMVFGTDTVRVYNVHLESIRLRKYNYNFIDSLILSFNSQRISEVRYISGRLRHAYIKRSRQVNALSRHIKKSPYKVIVCGDFNDTPVSYTYQKVRGKLNDAFMNSGKGIGNTYRGDFPSFRIDYIFHSKSLHSFNYHTHRISFSDHYPVSCCFKLDR